MPKGLSCRRCLAFKSHTQKLRQQLAERTREAAKWRAESSRLSQEVAAAEAGARDLKSQLESSEKDGGCLDFPDVPSQS